MEDLSLGFKLLRNSLILLLVSSLIPLIVIGSGGSSVLISGDIGQIYGLAYSLEADILSSLIALASIFLMYKGWGEMCQGLDETFCLVQKVMKYGVMISILFLAGFVVAVYTSLPTIMKSPLSIVSSMSTWLVLLIITMLASLSVFLSIIYGFYKLGSLTNSRNLKIGSALLLIGPILSYASITVSVAMTLLALIILIAVTNTLSKAEIEVEEHELGHESIESSPIFKEELPEKAKVPQRKADRPREISEWEEMPLPKKKVARLIGPNGFSIDLRIGIRTFGRRDFAGYVSDEDLDYISRRHFEIRGTSQGYFIRDLGSLNGTWVNGRKLARGESVKLSNGSLIDVAEVVRLRFVSEDSEDLGVPAI